MSHVLATIYCNVYRMEFSVKKKNNNNNIDLTDIPLGKQLRRESLTPAKVFEKNVSTLRLGPSSGNKEMTTVNDAKLAKLAG